MALGAGAFAVGFAVPYQRWRRHHLALAAAAFALLVVVLVPGIGARVNGARRWIRFGTLVGVQPSEFAKIALVIWLAACCERHLSPGRRGAGLRRPVSLFGGFLLPAGVVGLAAFLVLCEPDFGTAVLIAALGIGILVVCGAPLLYVALLCVAAVPLLQKLILDSPERLERIAVFVDPWRDPQGAGYQLIQSLIAIGSGGTLGKGLGLGVQKMGFLPAASNDFIFAIICEELGFVGAAAVICLYVWLLCEGLRVALRARDTFGFALALGITSLIGLQALVNVAVATGAAPTKGLSLPFLSAGGSSLFFSMWAAGILVSIACCQERPRRFELVPWHADVPAYERALRSLARGTFRIFRNERRSR